MALVGRSGVGVLVPSDRGRAVEAELIDGVYAKWSDERLRSEMDEKAAELRSLDSRANAVRQELTELQREDKRRALKRGEGPGLVESTLKMFDDVLGGGQE